MKPSSTSPGRTRMTIRSCPSSSRRLSNMDGMRHSAWPPAATGLPLNDATLPWVLAEISMRTPKKPDPYGWPARWHTLNSLLSNADAELLARHKQAILDVKSLEEEVVEIVAERIDLLAADAEFCWRELERFCVESKDVEDIGEVDLDHALRIDRGHCP